MRPRQSFLGDPGDLDEGAGPRAPLLEGPGASGWGTGLPSHRPWAPRAPGSGHIRLHAAFHLGNAINTSH